MANLLTKTEQFDDVAWTKTSTITPNLVAPPTFAGIYAGYADKVEDTGATYQVLQQDVTISADTNPYILSGYVRKDADTSRYPTFELAFRNGSQIYAGIRFNTSTGGRVTEGGSVGGFTSGTDDIDSLWWRWWVKATNDGTNNAIRAFYAPAASADGAGDDSTAVGSIYLWGVQLEQATSVGPYVPDPFYAFMLAPSFPSMTRARRRQGWSVSSPGGFF